MICGLSGAVASKVPRKVWCSSLSQSSRAGLLYVPDIIQTKLRKLVLSTNKKTRNSFTYLGSSYLDVDNTSKPPIQAYYILDTSIPIQNKHIFDIFPRQDIIVTENGYAHLGTD